MPDELNENNQQTSDTTAGTETKTDDLSQLFTPEDVAAKKEALTASKAEEDRRTALTEDERTAEDAAKADEAKLNEVPEEYAAFNIPDGLELDKDLLDTAMPQFKELGLSQAKAQKMIDLFSEKIAPAMAKRQQEAWQAETDGWKTSAMKDPEIGGVKFEKSISDAKRVINTIGTPELTEVFNKYGLGNHPEFVRVFTRIAPLLKEDTIDKGGNNSVVKGKTVEEIASRFYKN